MSKFFILCLLVVVALAATKPKTYEQCEKVATQKCPKCAYAKKDSKKCAAAKKAKAGDTPAQTAKQTKCKDLNACYNKVAKAIKKKESKARREMEKTYSKLCPVDKTKCVDQSNSCPTWAAGAGKECTKNPDWMLTNCVKSCCPICTGKNTLRSGTCPSKERKDLCVKNTHSSCHTWATKKDQCKKNPKWMVPNCMESCCEPCMKDANKCPNVKEACKNKHQKPNKKKGNKACVDWAKDGQCKSNSIWMSSNCAKECCPICAATAPAAEPVQVAQPRIVYVG